MSNKTQGFTLLEILIALFIFTLVSLIMGTTLRSVLNSQEATDAKSQQFSKIQLAILIMSRDFEQTMPRAITNAKGMLEAPLQGSPHQVSFTHGGLANPGDRLQRSSLQRTEYALDNNQLIRSHFNVLDQAAKTEPIQRILLTDMQDLRFEYLDPSGKFQNNWPPPEAKQDSLPRAVRITLTGEKWGKIYQLYLLPGPPLAKTT